MMSAHLLRCVGLTGVLLATCFMPGLAQAQAPTASGGSLCGLVPLACPGPVPPPPPPLLGPPDDEAAAPPAPPPPAHHRHRARKPAHKKAA